MDDIILDSYYMIKLHQDRFKDINIFRLCNLLYLTEAYYMCVNDEDSLYSSDFYLCVLRNS